MNNIFKLVSGQRRFLRSLSSAWRKVHGGAVFTENKEMPLWKKSTQRKGRWKCAIRWEFNDGFYAAKNATGFLPQKASKPATSKMVSLMFRLKKTLEKAFIRGNFWLYFVMGLCFNFLVFKLSLYYYLISFSFPIYNLSWIENIQKFKKTQITCGFYFFPYPFLLSNGNIQHNYTKNTFPIRLFQ